MNNNLIEVLGKKYYLDVNAIIMWSIKSSEQLKETEITENYELGEDKEFDMTQKFIRELKTNDSQKDTIKYDFIKYLISPFLTNMSSDDLINNVSFAIIFNTLLNMGFLIEVE